MNSVQAVLASASTAYRTRNGPALAESFLWDPTTVSFGFVRRELQNSKQINLEDLVESHLVPTNSASELLATVITSTLAYIRDFESPIGGARDSPGARALRDYKNFSIVHGNVSTLFRNSETVWFADTVRKSSQHLVKLANHSDIIISPEPDSSKVADATSRLIKTVAQAVQSFNTLPKAINEDVLIRAGAIFSVANLLFKTYFRIQKVTLFPGVLAQVRSIVPLLDQVPRAFSVEYRYWVGRYGLDKRTPREARVSLQKAFDDCTNASKNKRLILIYLVAASLACGSFPSPALLAAGNLGDQFGPLIHFIKIGEGARCQQHLERWMPWFHKRQLYFFLLEKVDVLVWRNLCRRISVIKRVIKPHEDQRSLQLADVLIGLRLSYQDSSYDIFDAENICMSLIEQGYIRGYILHSRGTVGLAGSGGFFPVAETRTLVAPKAE